VGDRNSGRFPPSGGENSGGDSHGISLGDATRVWWLVALNSFGGPIGQISVMHRLLVEERRWFSERRFLHSLNYCMLLPGPEAQQLASYLGWTLHGTRGGLIAGGLFILPGFVAILALSVLYAGFGDVGWVQAVFYGIKPAVIAIVAAALVRISSRALRNRVMYAVAGAAFVAIFFFAVPFPLIIAGAGVIGFVGGRTGSPWFRLDSGHQEAAASDGAARVSDELSAPRPRFGRTALVAGIGLSLWFVPLLVLAIVFGRNSVWIEAGTFFSTAAVVTFGGAYAVLAYIAQQAVETFGWLQPGEMLDGLGMAETTPGPLIQVVQFVGFMAAFRSGLAIDPMLAGVLGAVLTTWVTFVPSFLWIFMGAPYVERLRGNRDINATLSAVTAAVVGVMLNLAVWFAIHTVFREVGEMQTGFGLRIYRPDLSSLDPAALLLAAGALLAVFRFKWSVPRTLGVGALVGAVVHLLFVG
jgi:chromate transporter